MIYIHIPFCRSFCTYCDFYSEIACKGRDSKVLESFTDELCAEIEARRDEIEASMGLNTLYIGGGTPSVLPLALLRRIVDTLGYGPYREFTIEVNPDDICEKGTEYIEGLISLGVTRISMGVQSLDDSILRWMNRRHDAAEAAKAFSLLRSFPGLDLSVDLIFGVPEMGIKKLRKSVETVLEWRPDHISAYQLSIEEGSTLAEMIEQGKVQEAPEEDCRNQYDFLCARLREAGYHHYEISNWALPGHEAVHNSAYWTRQPYIGLGPGAHSLSIAPDGTQHRSWNSDSLNHWTSEGETLTPKEIREEEIMLLARTDKGPIPESRWFVSDDLISELI